MREWIAREYSMDPDWIEESMTMAQISLRYYLGHKDETTRLKAQSNMLAAALRGTLETDG